jgi:hypothetical protein
LNLFFDSLPSSLQSSSVVRRVIPSGTPVTGYEPALNIGENAEARPFGHLAIQVQQNDCFRDGAKATCDISGGRCKARFKRLRRNAGAGSRPDESLLSPV